MKFASCLFLLSSICLLIPSQVEGFHSTKVAYLDSFTPEQIDFINNVDNYKVNECEPQQIYLFMRHGARYPNEKQVIKSRQFMTQVEEHRSTQMSVEQPDVFDSITISFYDKPNYALSDVGKMEMHLIAQKFAKRYSNLLDKNVIVKSIKEAKPYLNTQSSHKDRSVDSAKSFLHGLFSSSIDKINEKDEKKAQSFNETLRHLVDNIKINDQMLRLFSECMRYLIEIENNNTATAELYKFKMGSEMKQLIENFKKRHQLEGMNIEPGVLIKLFTLCNIEHAHRMDNNWCKLFVQDDYDVMSYYNDLKGYLKKSYGHQEINANMAFLIIKDALNEMEKFIRNDSDKQTVLLRFGHAENMFPLMTALGLFNNSIPLRADNYKENLNRSFRSGILTPFSANLAFVLHKCKNDDYTIKVLVNELPVGKLTNAGELKCSRKSSKNKAHDSLCDFSDFKEQMKNFIQLDYDSVCHLMPLKNVKAPKIVKETKREL